MGIPPHSRLFGTADKTSEMPPYDCWSPATPFSSRFKEAFRVLLASLPGPELTMGGAFLLILYLA